MCDTRAKVLSYSSHSVYSGHIIAKNTTEKGQAGSTVISHKNYNLFQEVKRLKFEVK